MEYRESSAILGPDTDLDSFSRALLTAMLSLKEGDFSVRMPADVTGLNGKIADAFNDIALVSERRARETSRVSYAVGKEGKLKQRMSVPGVAGGWADEVAAINTLIDDLVWPTTEVTRAVGAVAKGDLGQSMALEVDGRPLEGEFLRSAKLVNSMIDQLSVFTSEVTRVAREVGTEGKLGGQAQVKGVSGVWKDLTESVNQMAGNLTAQVRNIADVTIAVANGDLSKKITVDVRGEILQLKEAINTMVDQLRSLRRRSDARRARSGHRRQAGRAGGRAGRRRHVERPDRLRERDGVEPDRAGAQHRRRHDRRRPRRPVAQDHGRRERRDSRAERHHQHDGGPAERVRLGSHPRRARGRHRRQARRSRRGAGRRRHVEGPDRLRQRDGDNLTAQVRNIAEVTTAVARGDLSRKITVDVKARFSS